MNLWGRVGSPFELPLMRLPSFRFIEYQAHPEAKSLAPDGSPCISETRGLLERAHIIAGEFRYVGKETDRKREESDLQRPN